MRIAMVQVARPPDEPAAPRWGRVGSMVGSAAGADLLVLPEAWGPGCFFVDPLRRPCRASGRRRGARGAGWAIATWACNRWTWTGTVHWKAGRLVANQSPRLHLQPAGSGVHLAVAPARLIVTGYTGRDEKAVAAHIAELGEIGVPAPATVPAFYDLDPQLATTDPAISVDRPNTSGEV